MLHGAVFATVIVMGVNLIHILLDVQFLGTGMQTENDLKSQTAGDGCGIDHAGDDGQGFSANPSYLAYSNTDVDLYKRVEECVNHLIILAEDSPYERIDPTNLTMLQCQLNISLEIFQSHVSRYNTIWFIGDSLVQQQYLAFLCMVDPSLNHLQFKSDEPATNRSSILYDATFNNSLGGNKFPHIVFSSFGYLFDPTQPNLYSRSFPEAVATLTSNDAIVVGASAHYNSVRGREMELALAFIANQSLVAAAPIFYMENSAEMWPTSNGLYTPSCFWYCRCEPLDLARMVGQGNLTTFNNSTILKDLGLVMPDTDFFGRLYPDMQFPNNDSLCIPDCIPPTWRMDTSRSIFLSRERNNITNSRNNISTVPNRVHYVPVWRQLVAAEVSNSRLEVGDCTHKSLNAIIIMNQQLLRTMIQAKED